MPSRDNRGNWYSFCSPRRLRLLLLILWGAACAAGAREIPITVLHTTDLHGHVLPSSSYEGNRRFGGLLRCAAVIEAVRREEPHVLLLDCGDVVQGSVESWLTRGKVMIRALDALQYDAWVPGNHDLDWGVDAFRQLHDATQVPLLAANITGLDESRLGRISPFVVREFEGVRVVTVGLTTPAIPLWLLPDCLSGLGMERSVDALRRIMPKVRSLHPDVLLLAVHQGCQGQGDDAANEVQSIAQQFPEVDVIVGGHQHMVVESARLNGVLFSEAGYHGGYVGRVDLAYDTVERRVVRKSARLIEVDENMPVSESLVALLSNDVTKALTYKDKVIGHAELPIGGSCRLPGQSPAQQLISAAMASAVHAEVVLHGILDEVDVPVGPLTRSDVWQLVPYENEIGVLYLTMSEIRDVLEENTSLAGAVHFLGVRGVRYELWPDAPPGQRIRNLTLADGSKPHARRRFRTATSSFVLASGGGRFRTFRRLAMQPECRLDMTDIDTRSAVIDYVRKHSPLSSSSGGEVRVVRGLSSAGRTVR